MVVWRKFVVVVDESLRRALLTALMEMRDFPESLRTIMSVWRGF
jgi:hypothetical protein